MAIKKKEEMPFRPIEIDLTGPEGNVFCLMGFARNLARQLLDNDDPRLAQAIEFREELKCMWELGMGDKPKENPKSMGDLICQQMMESDYENAIQVFDSYFGGIVTLYR